MEYKKIESEKKETNYYMIVEWVYLNLVLNRFAVNMKYFKNLQDFLKHRFNGVSDESIILHLNLPMNAEITDKIYNRFVFEMSDNYKVVGSGLQKSDINYFYGEEIEYYEC